MNGFKSYMLFAGRSTMLTTGILTASVFAFMAAARIVCACNGGSEVWDFLRFIGEVVWISSIFIVLCRLFNANLKSSPGYKFFHSLPDASSDFRRALLTANIYLLIGTAIFTAAELLLFGNTPQMFMSLDLFMLGWINLFGSMGVWFRTFPPFFVVGFMTGFLNGIVDDEELPDEVRLVLFAVCAVFCVVGILYSIINIKRLWEKER